MNRVRTKLLLIELGVVLSVVVPAVCAAQSDRGTAGSPAQLAPQTNGLPTRSLPQTGSAQLQAPAPVVSPPIIQLIHMNAALVVAPVIVHPVINSATSAIPPAPIITAPVINLTAPVVPSGAVAITPQVFGLLTLPLLPVSVPGQPGSTGPTILDDLTRQRPAAKTDTGTGAGSYGPLALVDLSKRSPTTQTGSPKDAAGAAQVNGLLSIPTLSNVLLSPGQTNSRPGSANPPK